MTKNFQLMESIESLKYTVITKSFKMLQLNCPNNKDKEQHEKLTLAAALSLLNCAKAACFCGTRGGGSNVHVDWKGLTIKNAKFTIRPVLEKSRTDSAPKYLRSSSFSSPVRSAGRWRTSSVLEPFAWTFSSFSSIFLEKETPRSHNR